MTHMDVEPLKQLESRTSSGGSRGVCTADYTCPGEDHPIPRAVHLARLASGFEACRGCPHQTDVGSLPKHVSRRSLARAQKLRPELVSEQGIRGRYLNDLTREKLSAVVEHVLNLVDQERLTASGHHCREGALRIVIGYDFRWFSPDLAMGAVSVLRRSGCDVADLGPATRPLIDYAVERFHPHVGLFITGGVQGEGWAGLDVVDYRLIPWCFPGRLTELADLLNASPARLSRSQGTYQPVSIHDDYLATLGQQFHGMRPLRIGVSCSDPMIRSFLHSLIEKTPCHLFFQNGLAAGHQSAKSFINPFSDRHVDLAFSISSDGRACTLFDETGRALSSSDLLRLISVLNEEETRVMSLSTEGSQNSDDLLSEADSAWEQVTGTEADLLQQQLQKRIPLAADQQGRVWMLTESARCDALQTMARCLEAISRSERPVSDYHSDRSPIRSGRTSRNSLLKDWT